MVSTAKGAVAYLMKFCDSPLVLKQISMMSQKAFR